MTCAHKKGNVVKGSEQRRAARGRAVTKVTIIILKAPERDARRRRQSRREGVRKRSRDALGCGLNG